MSDVEVLQVSWQDMESHLRDIRTKVFIEEQNVPEDLEWEDADLNAVHLLVKTAGQYVATARLLNTGQIGRMAVLKPYRLSGLGTTMLAKLLSIAEEKNMQRVTLNAQVDAMAFYIKQGFKVESDVFDDAGIPHRKMSKSLI